MPASCLESFPTDQNDSMQTPKTYVLQLLRRAKENESEVAALGTPKVTSNAKSYIARKLSPVKGSLGVDKLLLGSCSCVPCSDLLAWA